YLLRLFWLHVGAWLVEDASAWSLLLFSLGFLGFHRLLHPVVGGGKVLLTSIRIATFQIRLFAEQQVQVRHRIVVILAQLKSFVEIFDAFLYLLLILSLKVRAQLLVLDRLIGLDAGCGLAVHAALVSFRPVDYSNRVVRFRIARVSFDDLSVIVLRLIKVLELVFRLRGSAGHIEVE